jgi:chemotaxis protein CheC
MTADGSLSPLTEIERDALAEVSNIAMARAAQSLRLMVGHEVLLSVPRVEVISQEAAGKIVTRSGNPRLVAVRQDFTGAFSGRALLIFPETASLELVRVVVGSQLSLDDIVHIEDEALAETGNIILNSWVATAANLLRLGLKMSLPMVLRGESSRMFKNPEISDDLVLFLHIEFAIRHVQISGYVALIMDIPSLGTLRAVIADFIAGIAKGQ